MSVSRTALRLVAACVASGALIGAAALPALADGGSRIGEQGRGYVHSDRLHTPGEDHDHGGQRHLDHHRGWYRDRGHGHDRFGGGHWDRGRHHGWYGGRHHDRRFGDWLRDRSRHHGWYGERQRHHGHFDSHHG